MILNNAINLLKMTALVGGFESTTGNAYDMMCPVVDTTNTAVTKYWSGFVSGTTTGSGRFNVKPFSSTELYVRTSYSFTSADINILVGSGTTPVTVNDYRLESLISTVSKQSGSCNITYITNNDIESLTEKLIMEISIANTDTDDITISEIGLAQTVYTTNYNASSTVLLYREVLDTPVIIPANGFSTFQIEIEVEHS